MNAKLGSQQLSVKFVSLMRLVIVGLLVLGMGLFATGGVTLAQGPPSTLDTPPTLGPPEWVSDELLVGLRAGVSRGRSRVIFNSLGATAVGKIPQIDVHIIQVPPIALEAVERALSRLPEVEFVERNNLLPPVQVPNDPQYLNQWHLPMISGSDAWEISQGAPEVIIAVLDSGVDPTHPDLAEKIVFGYNFFDNDTDTSDVYGHGTKVAGSAAAISNNGIGVASVAWKNLLMPIRVTDTRGYGYISAIAKGLTYAVDNGAKVMNLSFAGIARSSTITSAAQYVVGQGGLVVAAAGNCGCLDSTAENPYIISVSATGRSDNLASFSSRGDYVDLSAPGVSILTTVNGGGYGSVSGTSFSSPVTAGVVALMMSANPDLTPAEVEDLLEASADDLGAEGYDSSFGFGRVNAYEAVLAAVGSSPPPPDTTPPSLSISAPAEGAMVSGTITVTVSASDDGGVTEVNLYLDGALLATDNAEPYSFSWDTTQTSDGTHTLEAVAYDGAGNSGTSGTVSVSVDNAVSDTTPPTVTITSPTDGARVRKRRVSIKLNASDDVQVQSVEIYVDGRLIGSASCASTSCSPTIQWDIKKIKVSKGYHTLSAIAFDAAGNQGSSSSVTVKK